jgi:hypothetical protein
MTRCAPIVPLDKEERRKYSDATHRFSDTISRRFGALAREEEEIEVFQKPKVSARRRIAPIHPWYRKRDCLIEKVARHQGFEPWASWIITPGALTGLS